MSIEVRRTRAGKTYYVVRIKSGRELVASRAFDLKHDAEQWERQQKHLLETGRPLPPKKSFTLAHLIAQFQEARKDGNPHSVRTDNDNLAKLPSQLLLRSLASIQAEDIRAHLIAQLRQGLKPATVARAKTTLSALFTYADRQGLLHQPHPVRSMAKISELSVTQRSVSPAEIPTPEELKVRIDALRERRDDVADVYEFKSLTGLRWGELRAARVSWYLSRPLPQLAVDRSHSDGYAEKGPKSWRGRRLLPLSPRALEIFEKNAADKDPDDYLFTNQQGGQFKAGVVRKYDLGFRRHSLRHYAASTWLRLGTPVHEVAEYLGDDPRTVLRIYAHVLGEGQRRDHLSRLADAERRTAALADPPLPVPGPDYGPR